MSGDGCTCDYSYTCPQCRNAMDIENQRQYADEMHAWIISCIEAVAAKLDVTLPDKPEHRGY